MFLSCHIIYLFRNILSIVWFIKDKKHTIFVYDWKGKFTYFLAFFEKKKWNHCDSSVFLLVLWFRSYSCAFLTLKLETMHFFAGIISPECCKKTRTKWSCRFDCNVCVFFTKNLRKSEGKTEAELTISNEFIIPLFFQVNAYFRLIYSLFHWR